jgi:hypothetical protein
MIGLDCLKVGPARNNLLPQPTARRDSAVHHQLMVHVEERIQAQAQKITLPAVASLDRLHLIPSANHLCVERITNRIARNPLARSHFPAIHISAQPAFSHSISTATNDDQPSWFLSHRQM